MDKNKSLIPIKKVSRFQKHVPADWLQKIIEKAVENLNFRDAAYIAFHASTGLRASDIITIEMHNIEWNNNRVNIFDQKKTSTGPYTWRTRQKNTSTCGSKTAMPHTPRRKE